MKPNPRKERSTIRDIAALSGLSIASISRYFNGLKVRQTTAEKIEKALTIGFMLQNRRENYERKRNGV